MDFFVFKERDILAKDSFRGVSTSVGDGDEGGGSFLASNFRFIHLHFKKTELLILSMLLMAAIDIADSLDSYCR